MRSTVEKMSSDELVKVLNELDNALDSAMVNGCATDESMDIFSWMTVIIDELEARHIHGWWSPNGAED